MAVWTRPSGARVLGAIACTFVVLGGCAGTDGVAPDTSASPDVGVVASATSATGGQPTGSPTTADDTASEAATEQDTGGEPTLRVVYDGTTCTYEGPSEAPAGIVTITAVNNGDRGFGALFLLLHEDATVDELVAAHQPEPYVGPPLDDLAQPVGTIGRMESGNDRSTSTGLAAGDHVLLCLVDTDVPDDPASIVAQPAGVTITE